MKNNSMLVRLGLFLQQKRVQLNIYLCCEMVVEQGNISKTFRGWIIVYLLHVPIYTTSGRLIQLNVNRRVVVLATTYPVGVALSTHLKGMQTLNM